MELLLKRINLLSTFTEGDLYIDGNFFCNTLEDANRDYNKNGVFDGVEKKIPNETCIPFGEYVVKVTMSPKFKRELPRLYNVPSFEGILIHRGNYIKDTSGCILVGERKGVKGVINNSTGYELKLTRLIKEAQNKGNKITIKII